MGSRFGPLSMSSTRGGVTVLKAPPGAPRTALLLTLSGRMKLNGGNLTVLGHKNEFSKIFADSAIAYVDEVDGVAPSVTVRDIVTEEMRWRTNWWRWVPRANDQQIKDMIEYLFQDIPIPPMNAFVADLPGIEQALLRIAVANTRCTPLLVVGQLDFLPEATNRRLLLERLVQLGEHQSIITVNANAGEFADLDIKTVDVPGNLEFWQRGRTAAQVANLTVPSVAAASESEVTT